MVRITKEPFNEMFGEYLKRKRKEKKLSQDKLARLAGVSRQQITSWENGYNNISVSNLCKLLHTELFTYQSFHFNVAMKVLK